MVIGDGSLRCRLLTLSAIDAFSESYPLGPKFHPILANVRINAPLRTLLAFVGHRQIIVSIGSRPEHAE